MSKNNTVLGTILGDHAGIGPEIAIKAALATEGYIPLFIGNRAAFEKSLALVPSSNKLKFVDWTDTNEKPSQPGSVYFHNVPGGANISFGNISSDSGRLCYDGIIRGLDLERNGVVDALVMEPITKQSLHHAGLKYSSENDIFADYYHKDSVPAVIKCKDIFRATVVGHYAFREIIGRLSTAGILSAAHRLLDIMSRYLGREHCKIAISALNPHAGEDGLFGDEEIRIITPAVQQLLEEKVQVIGPCSADTVFLKAVYGEVGGVVFLYHDQGNIAMKARNFGEGVLIYSGIPADIVSVGHGSALDIAGKGIADEKNTVEAIETGLSLIERR